MRSLLCLVYIPILFTLTTVACAPKHRASQGASVNAPVAQPAADNQLAVNQTGAGAPAPASASAPTVEQQIADLTQNLAWTKRLLSNNYALPMDEETGFLSNRFRSWVFPAEQKAEIKSLLQTFITQSQAKLALKPNKADQKSLDRGVTLLNYFNEAP